MKFLVLIILFLSSMKINAQDSNRKKSAFETTAVVAAESPEDEALRLERQLINAYLKQSGTTCKKLETIYISSSKLKDCACSGPNELEASKIECTFSGQSYIPNVTFDAICKSDNQTAIDCARDNQIGSYAVKLKSVPLTEDEASQKAIQ